MRLVDAEFEMAELAARMRELARIRGRLLRALAVRSAMRDGTGVRTAIAGAYTVRELLQIARMDGRSDGEAAERLSGRVMPMERGARKLAAGLAARANSKGR